VQNCIGTMNMSLNAVLGRHVRIRDRGHRHFLVITIAMLYIHIFPFVKGQDSIMYFN